jgi:quinol monooxygenase YgiN
MAAPMRRRRGEDRGMTRFAITVRFEIDAGMMKMFMPLIEDNARASVAREPGCRRFDVLTSEADVNVVFLYEIYDSKQAFDLHLVAPHYQTFDAATRGMVVSKTVHLYNVQESAKP